MIARQVAAWVVADRGIPAPVVVAAQRHLFDGLATAVGAVRRGQGSAAITVALGLGGPEESTLIGSSNRISAPAAALANGTLVHALDFDDTHAGGLVHATSVVLPAALAVGEATESSGRQVLDAAVTGLEIATRVASAAPHGFHSRGVHATMAVGVFSSAAVAARLMGLDERQTTSTLGIAGSQAGGLLAFLGTEASTKQLHPGMAGYAGILAARLAQAGATGPSSVFDGPHSVFDALTTGPVDTSVILRGLGSSEAFEWETTRIGIKPYPACQLSHATLDAVHDAQRQRDFTADEVVELRATVHPDSASVVCAPDRDLAAPSSDYAAKFSLPWSVAALVVDGHVGLSSYTADSIARPDVAALARRVVTLLGSGDRAAADAPGRVEIELSDGTRLLGEVTRSAGGPDNPLTDEQLVAKADDLVGGDASELWTEVAALADRSDLTDLFRALETLTTSSTAS